jgi:hypothetical protein
LALIELSKALGSKLLRDRRLDPILQRGFVGRACFTDVGRVGERERLVSGEIRGRMMFRLDVEGLRATLLFDGAS